MKYQVANEWRDWFYLISKDTVCNLVNDKVKWKIHNFIAWPFMIWADRTKSEFYKFIKSDKVSKIAITIPAQMWHHIAVIADKLYLFDCGVIKDDDLYIVND